MNEQTIIHDGFDRAVYDEAARGYRNLAGAERFGAGDDRAVPTAPALVRDLFWSFYQRTPQQRPVDATDPTYRVNHEIVAETLGTQEWRDVRDVGTVGDEMLAAMATVGVAGRALRALPAETVTDLQNAARLSEQAAQLLDEAETLEEIAGAQNAPHLAKLARRRRADAEATRAAADEARAKLAAADPERADAIRREARAALVDAKAELADLQNAEHAFGGSIPGLGRGTGEASGVPLGDKLALADRLRREPRLRQLAALCGRLMRIAFAVQQARVDHLPDEVTSITVGDDLARLLPSEITKLGDPDLEDLFMIGLTERSLLQYELHGRENLGRGPIIVALDESSSMTAHVGDGITRDLWSKAVALALLAVAKAQKRDYACIHFSGSGQLRVETFSEGKATPSETIALAGHFYNGGTVYGDWMMAAAALARDSRFDKADVILVSDGDGHYTADQTARWQATRTERAMRAYGVLIADPRATGADRIAGTDRAEQSMADLMDAHFTLADLAGEGEVLNTIFSV